MSLGTLTTVYSMTDRVFALWQALYPNSWVQPMAQVQGTYVYGPGDVMDSTSRECPLIHARC